MSLLEIRNLTRNFGGLVAVGDVSFGVEPGCIKGVIGPNGAGKTTLFNLIAGSIPPSSGSVHFEGRKLTGRKPHEVAARGILRTFQQIRLCPHDSVRENVLLGRHTKTRAGFVSGLLSLPRSRREEKASLAAVDAVLERCGLGADADKEAGSLPFGRQRAVELARALAAEPRFLLLDEPASGLNITETRELSATIAKIRDSGITVLLVEHDMSLVMNICDEIVVLSFGKMIAEGIPAEIQKNPEVVAVYLGDEDVPCR